jgi:hypothetical protein
VVGGGCLGGGVEPSGSIVGIEIEHPVAVNQFIECRLDYDVG